MNYTAQRVCEDGQKRAYSASVLLKMDLFCLTATAGCRYCGALDPPSPKRQALEASGTFNPRHAQVHHPLFQDSEFFDPQDLLQLKYETVRAVHQDQYSISKAAAEFGLSRPTVYQTQENFQSRGVEGLLPAKRGPKQAHKLTSQVLQHLHELLPAQPDLNAHDACQRARLLRCARLSWMAGNDR